MYTHVRFDMMGAYLGNENRHPQKVMEYLGISYEKSVPQSIACCWQFFNCCNIPDSLPNYIEVFKSEPLSHIGFGLSKEDAVSLTKLSDIDVEEYFSKKEAQLKNKY